MEIEQAFEQETRGGAVQPCFCLYVRFAGCLLLWSGVSWFGGWGRVGWGTGYMSDMGHVSGVSDMGDWSGVSGVSGLPGSHDHWSAVARFPISYWLGR